MHFSAQCGRFFYFEGTETNPTPPSTSRILLEDEDVLLLENDSAILLEA